MAFGDTEERLSQFGDKWQILNAIREHYLMKREADHGSQLFWDRIFWTRLAGARNRAGLDESFRTRCCTSIGGVFFA